MVTATINNIGQKKYSPFILPFLLALIPILAIVFDEKWVPFYIIVLLLFYFFEPSKKLIFKKNKKYLTPFVVMMAVYVMYTFMSSDIMLSLKVLERQVSLLLFPLIIFTLDWDSDRIHIFFKTFVITLFLFSLFSFAKLYLFYSHNIEWIETMNSMQDSETYLLFKYPYLVDTHPTYWSYLLVVGNIMVIGFGLFSQFLRSKWLIISLVIVFDITLLLLSARTPLFINLIVHIGAILVYIKFRKIHKPYGIVVGLLAVIFLILVFLFTNDLIFLKILEIPEDERFYLWPIAFEKIRENYFLLGEGLGHGHNYLKNYIIQHGDMRRNYNSFDLHNQYLRHYLDMGLIGITALIYLLGHPIFNVSKFRLSYSYVLVCGVFLFGLACFTEAYLFRLKGIVLFAVLTSFLVIATNSLSTSETKNSNT